MGLFSFLFGKQPAPKKERGTVVFQTQEKKVAEVAGVTLTSSLFIKKFTEEETRENAKENRWFYEPAYQKVMQTVEVDPKQVSAMLDELLVAFTAGNPRREYEVVKRFLPDGTWLWPAYEAFVLPGEEEYYRECLDEIQTASLFDLLMMLKATELRGLYTEFASEKPKLTGRKKADISNALIGAITEERNLALTQCLRGEAIAKLESPGTPDYKEMGQLLCRRIAAIAYEIRRKAQRIELAKLYPMWEFSVITHDDTPQECLNRKGKRFRYDDPIWDSLPPCDHLTCACSVRTVILDRK